MCFIAAFSAGVNAQEITIDYRYEFGRIFADEAPQITSVKIDYPKTARQNGVEGTVKASLILGEDGKVRDIKILQSLPHGVDAAVTKGLQNLTFNPAIRRGQPIASPMEFDYIVSVVYEGDDTNVIPPKLLESSLPVYPEKYRAEKTKGKVLVSALFTADGKIQILGVISKLPKEFEEAASEAAAKLRFQPAVHKKSKAAVSQRTFVEYDFKP